MGFLIAISLFALAFTCHKMGKAMREMGETMQGRGDTFVVRDIDLNKIWPEPPKPQYTNQSRN